MIKLLKSWLPKSDAAPFKAVVHSTFHLLPGTIRNIWFRSSYSRTSNERIRAHQISEMGLSERWQHSTQIKKQIVLTSNTFLTIRNATGYRATSWWSTRRRVVLYSPTISRISLRSSWSSLLSKYDQTLIKSKSRKKMLRDTFLGSDQSRSLPRPCYGEEGNKLKAV